MRDEVVLIGAVRTAIGNFNGAFASVPATQLGSAAIRAAVDRSGLSADKIDEVIFGNVLSAGLGQNPARQAAVGAGLPLSTGATTVEKVCGSGLKAVMLAAQAVRCSDSRFVVAGGMENMTRAPYLLDKARNGYRMGHGQLIDSMIKDGLWDAYGDLHMGSCAEKCAAKYAFDRKQQEEYAIESYQRALAAQSSGVFREEIVPVEVPGSKGSSTIVEDDGPKRFNAEKMRLLQPAFEKDGTITAATSSAISDGAAAVVVTSMDQAKSQGLKPVAKILGYCTVSGEPEWFTTAPAHAIAKLMDQCRLSLNDIGVFEINEAFAVVVLAAMKELNIPREKVNVLGGAIALGHPIGASGARTLVTLLTAMKQRNSRIGITSLCIGGGEAVAMAVELI